MLTGDMLEAHSGNPVKVLDAMFDVLSALLRWEQRCVKDLSDSGEWKSGSFMIPHVDNAQISRSTLVEPTARQSMTLDIVS